MHITKSSPFIVVPIIKVLKVKTKTNYFKHPGLPFS